MYKLQTWDLVQFAIFWVVKKIGSALKGRDYTMACTLFCPFTSSAIKGRDYAIVCSLFCLFVFLEHFNMWICEWQKYVNFK
jgi:hypothetical protein